jgi:hypothetical protein
MRYFNQEGVRVEAPTKKIRKQKEISGWAINVEGLNKDEVDTFINLWKKIKPTPLYR